MKYLRTYNESVRDKMLPLSPEIVNKKLHDTIDTLADWAMDDKFFKTKEEAIKYFSVDDGDLSVLDLLGHGDTIDEIYEELIEEIRNRREDENDEEERELEPWENVPFDKTNESVRDMLKPKAEEEIRKTFSTTNLNVNNAEKILKNAIQFDMPDILEISLKRIKDKYHELGEGEYADTLKNFIEDEYNVSFNLLFSLAVTTNSDIKTNDAAKILCNYFDMNINDKEIKDAFKSVQSIDSLYKEFVKKNPEFKTTPPDLRYYDDNFTEYNFIVYIKFDEDQEEYPQYPPMPTDDNDEGSGYNIGIKNDAGDSIYYTYYIEPFGGDDEGYANYVSTYQELLDAIKLEEFKI